MKARQTLSATGAVTVTIPTHEVLSLNPRIKRKQSATGSVMRRGTDMGMKPEQQKFWDKEVRAFQKKYPDIKLTHIENPAMLRFWQRSARGENGYRANDRAEKVYQRLERHLRSWPALDSVWPKDPVWDGSPIGFNPGEVD